MKIVTLLGAPGSGKGTQAKRLSESGKFLHFSTGDMLRKAIANREPTGLSADVFIKRGELVPDQVMIDLVRSAVRVVPSTSNVLLDGFPRTLPQAHALDSTLEIRVTAAVFLDVPGSVLLDRLTGRRICRKCGELFHITFFAPRKLGTCDKCGGDLFQRPDDQVDVVSKRLEIFAGQNSMLLSYYFESGRLTKIDGNRSADSIQSDLAVQLR